MILTPDDAAEADVVEEDHIVVRAVKNNNVKVKPILGKHTRPQLFISLLSDDNGPHTWGSEVFEPPIWDSRLHSINTWKEDKIGLGLYVVHIMSDNKKSNIFWGNMLY